ncbi:hypothetical protein NPIL_94241 [Nephila pilipes]|uniref:Uncharacterized protein n=1 Tax=Nephila pilipes TaxID=299642 RepID=A0A8X6U4B5_NEPPI|nr:hypothetical protein NPIL_94241 [Nephila pilipes]
MFPISWIESAENPLFQGHLTPFSSGRAFQQYTTFLFINLLLGKERSNYELLSVKLEHWNGSDVWLRGSIAVVMDCLTRFMYRFVKRLEREASG